MCLIVFAIDRHPRYKLILTANRDEFYERPTAPAAFWTDVPQIFGGRDLAAGGTWLGVTKTGRFAAVTNYRDPLAPAGKKSRGDLTKNFLAGQDSPDEYLLKIKSEEGDYSGFNLLFADFGNCQNEMFYFSNRGEVSAKLSAGIYGLSNHLLDSDWNKVERSKTKLSPLLQTTDQIAAEDLFQILGDRSAAPDEKLPETGVGIERERILSPVFIEADGYGTRSTTVLLIEHDGRAKFAEKTFVGTIGSIDREFIFEKPSLR